MRSPVRSKPWKQRRREQRRPWMTWTRRNSTRSLRMRTVATGSELRSVAAEVIHEADQRAQLRVDPALAIAGGVLGGQVSGDELLGGDEHLFGTASPVEDRARTERIDLVGEVESH